MKKILSIILSVTMILTTLSIGFTAYADVLEEKAIDNFVENSCEIIREYDADKDFISEDENVSVYSSDNSEDFQTCRLIVKADGAFNDFGAAEHIKGFMDFHILQYENETDTENAYNSLLTEKNVLSVSVDKIVSPAQAEEEEVDTSTDVFPESSNGHLCDWATERTQSAQVNEYIKKNNIPLNDITVGIIDQGIDYNHEFLQGRIKRTYFNSSTDGNENDELDVIDGHGTAVSSVVVDNTPESVSVAMYRVLDDEWENSVAGITMGILQAITDNVDIINISLGYTDKDDITKSACDLAYERNIPIVAGTGNEGYDIVTTPMAPANLSKSISIVATNKNNRNCYWCSSGLAVDLSAPGEEINVAVANNRYDVWDGTSFASPCVAAVIATIKSIHYDYSYDYIENRLKETAMSLEIYSDNSILNVDGYKFPKYLYSLDYGKGMIQIGKALGFEIPSAPKCNYQSGNYIDEIQIELKSDYPIYYTLDGSYPSASGTLYTEPITICEDTDLRAVAYDENNLIQYSNELECEYQIFNQGTDDMFEINENGCITQYINKGAITNLSVPSEINGIHVKTFTGKIFNDNTISKIVFPDTLEEIPESAFADNTNLFYVNTGGAKTIQRAAFFKNLKLHTIDMPNAEGIETGAFSNCSGIYDGFYVNAPKLKYIQKNGFYSCSHFGIEAPELEYLYSTSFCQSAIRYADFPNLKSIEKDGITRAPFYECSLLKVINAPNLENNAANTIMINCNQVQYINLPKYTGKLSSDTEYKYLNYYNVSKETAELSGLDYYDVNALGGSIRVTDAGLRFGFSFNESQTDKVEEYGFVYALGNVDPYSLYVEDTNQSNVYKLKANNRITHENNTTTYNLVFTDIPKTAYESQISARTYVKIDGMYFYSDKLCYSFNDIANAVLADGEIDQNTKDKLGKLLEV